MSRENWKNVTVEHQVPYTLIEWNRVSLLIKSEKIDDMKECQQYLAMWCSRMGNETPIAISCTAMCINAAVKEYNMRKPMELEELKMLLSITIIRIINYISEAKRSNAADSIYTAAQAAGIPRWVVELRHNASHRHMPTLGALKKGVEHCKNYLIREFWSKPMHEAIIAIGTHEENEVDEEFYSQNVAALKLQNDIIKAIHDYANWRYKNLGVAFYGKIAPLQTMQKFLRSDTEVFLGILVTPGNFLMNEQQAITLGEHTNDIQNWEIPHQMKLLWAPLMAVIVEADLLLPFVIQLLDVKIIASENSDAFTQVQAGTWVIEILSRAIDPSKEVFTGDDWSKILHKLVQAPEGFNTTFVESIMQKVPNINIRVRRRVRKIMQITLSESMLNDTSASASDSICQIYTASDLERLIQRNNTRNINGKQFGLFTIVDPLEEQTPSQMGLAPGQKYETVSLVIDDEWINEAKSRWEIKERMLLDTIDEDMTLHYEG